jgi:hypothetical protein
MLLRLLRQNTELSINAARFAFKQYSYGTKGPGAYCIFVAEKAV